MNDAPVKTLTAILDGRVLQLDVRTDCGVRAISVTMRLNFGGIREFKEPGWRDLGIGAANGSVYWWSARHLVAEAGDSVRDADITTDEDILFVFALTEAWLVVCETSVRMYRESDEVARLEFGDVVSEAVWDPPRLSLRSESGEPWAVAVNARGLEQV
jgi:hypothetical protein